MSDTIIKRSPDDFDWPATIFLYVVLVIMGVGMCFCLKRANRLIPNRFSFPLVDRGERRERGFHDLGAEEEGLLSHFSDVEDEDDAEVIDNQNAPHISRHATHQDDADEEEEQEHNEDFGNLQSHDTMFDSDDNSEDDQEDKLYKNPYNDNETSNNDTRK